MKKAITVLGLVLMGAWPQVEARYRAKEIQVRPAADYPDHLDFQNIVIGVHPATTEAETLEFFDTKNLFEQEIMPVLVVVENNNDFALRIHQDDIHLILNDATQVPALAVLEVVLRVSLRRPAGSVTTRPEILVRQIRDRRMVEDFEHKAFGEKLIAPHSSDHGVVFFPRPALGILDGMRLYFPEVYNLTEGQRLIFFEIELGRTKP